MKVLVTLMSVMLLVACTDQNPTRGPTTRKAGVGTERDSNAANFKWDGTRHQDSLNWKIEILP